MPSDISPQTKMMSSTLTVVAAVPLALYNAYLFHAWWIWFLVPVGLPVVGYWHALALWTVARWAASGSDAITNQTYTITIDTAVKVGAAKEADVSRLIALVFGPSLAMTVTHGLLWLVKGWAGL